VGQDGQDAGTVDQLKRTGCALKPIPGDALAINFVLFDFAVAGFGLTSMAHCDARPFAPIMRIARGIWANGERRAAVIFDF
jgi:hypothetical protein